MVLLRRPASICFIEANDVFVPGLIAGKSDGSVLGRGRLSPAKSALGASHAAPADSPAMVKLRRDITIDFVCFMAILSLILRLTIPHKTCDVGISEGCGVYFRLEL
jgi:hypothetical protein